MGTLHNSGRLVKRMLRAAYGKEVWRRVESHCDTLLLGNEGASWCVCPFMLSKASIVYSFGAGEDISFDLELIGHFGLHVHAFDPTPRSIDWIRSQTLPREFIFHPYGVADTDGRCKFTAPANPAYISHSMLERNTPGPAIEAPVRRLRTILSSLGHEKIHLLKMDIEGAEYAVLDNMLSSGIHADQLLIEFHHRWPEVGIEKTRRALRDLNLSGYRIFHISPSGEEYSFRRMPM
jgi:FkbM family methyltransferase